MKQKITRRQKDVARLIREKRALQRDALRHPEKTERKGYGYQRNA